MKSTSLECRSCKHQPFFNMHMLPPRRFFFVHVSQYFVKLHFVNKSKENKRKIITGRSNVRSLPLVDEQRTVGHSRPTLNPHLKRNWL
jgi:hypothetical protein